MGERRDVVGRKLSRGFYSPGAEDLAPLLIGKVLVHRAGRSELRARIVETEAYVGVEDLANHASKGRTGRTEVMFGPAGFAYVYLIYGVHDMFNVVCGAAGDAQAVLVRAGEPVAGFDDGVGARALSGPGKLARGMRITRALNGVDLTGDELYIADDGGEVGRIARGPRVGVDYAREWKEAALRFWEEGSNAVSRG